MVCHAYVYKDCIIALDTTITWKDEEMKEVNKMDTTLYVIKAYPD